MGFGVQGFGFLVSGFGFQVWGSGLRVQGLGFGAWGLNRVVANVDLEFVCPGSLHLKVYSVNPKP